MLSVIASAALPGSRLAMTEDGFLSTLSIPRLRMRLHREFAVLDLAAHDGHYGFPLKFPTAKRRVAGLRCKRRWVNGPPPFKIDEDQISRSTEFQPPAGASQNGGRGGTQPSQRLQQRQRSRPDQACEDDAQYGFQTDHPKRSAVELDSLLLGGMGRVVRRDRVDRPVQNPFNQCRAIRLATQRRVHLPLGGARPR